MMVGTAIGGLSDGVYYIIKHDRNNIKLVSTANNAVWNGNQSYRCWCCNAHTLNVAFDGVNTKFKVTHDGGRYGNVTRAAQLMISVNGVVQQPHQTASPSTGFGIDADSVVVFYCTCYHRYDLWWLSLQVMQHHLKYPIMM